MGHEMQLLAGLAVFIFCAVLLVARYLKRARISKRVLGSLAGEITEAASTIQPNALDRWMNVRFGDTKIFRELSEQLEISHSRVSPARVIVESLGWMIFGALVGLWAQGTAMMLVFAALALAIRLYVPTMALNKRRAKFQDQMDYALNLLTASVRAGHSLVRAIEIVAIQSEAPTSQEYAKALNSMRLGQDLGESLMKVAERMKSQELEWMVNSIQIHREAGGNLTEMFDTVVTTIKDRNDIRVLIRTLSTDGRVSGQVMSVLPLAVIGVFTLQSPTTFLIFIEDPVGNMLLGLAILLYLTGLIWIQKIVRVKF